jgi:hypothetical protein
MSNLSWFLIAAFVAAPLPLGAQSRNVEQTVPLGPGGTLSLHATKGSVRLSGWDRGEVEIRARIEADPRSSADYGQRAVDATSVDVTSAGGQVTIRSNYDRVPREGWDDSRTVPHIHYEIRAPRRLDLRLDLDRSNTTLAGFEGRVVIDIDRSELDAADLSGELRVTIDRGGDSRLTRVGGAVVIDSDRTNLSVDLARLESTSSLEIDRGDADVALAPGMGLTLETRLTKRANFQTNLPITVQEWSGDRGPSGAINGGGPRLAIEADRGRVRLRE